MTGKSKENNTIKNMMDLLGEIEDEIDEDDVELLAKVFRSQTFKHLLKVERSVERIQACGPIAVSKNAFKEAKQLYLQLKRKRKQSSLIAGLIDVLEDPHIQAVLATQDLIADEKLINRKADIEEELLDHIKKVKIDKNSDEPLGATIRRHEFTDRIAVARILHGGAAQRTGLLHQGDEILEVNGIETNGVSLDGVVSLLGLDSQTVEFKIIAAEESTEVEEEKEKIFMRAYFSYNPMEDPHIPCKDAGLHFTKGDILEIVDANEPKWWQARKHGAKDGKTGIIPSRQTQEKRLALKLWSPSNSFSGGELESSLRSLSPRDKNMSIANRSLSPTHKGKKKKPKKIKYQATKDIHTEEIMIYEEVTQIMADFDRPRPILITGVAALGCDDLRQSLVGTDPEKFQSPTYYTTRSKKGHEQEDKDYHFISRSEMEKGIRCNNFINIEMVKNHIFGIHINSINEIADLGKTCVMFVHPECLPVICGANNHPFVVFIKAPDIDLLDAYLKSRQENVLFETKTFTEEELYGISIDSEDIENNYGHYFDLVLTISDMETTLNQMYYAICKMATEPLWIPVR